MIPLLTNDQMRALDAHAIQEIGIPGLILMENAALAVLNEIEERLDDVEDLTIAVMCGPGNNGGDGLALARQLHLRGADVDVYLVADAKKLSGDALANLKLVEALDINVVPLTEVSEDFALDDYDLIVDALFGTGNSKAPDGIYAQVIDAMNESMVEMISVDVPSGVDASTGRVAGAAVMADSTVTFEHGKAGLLLPPGRDYVGGLVVSPISIPSKDEILSTAPFALPSDEDVRDLLPMRSRDAHKGTFGKLLIVAGSRGMSGAARLVALAALRSGVGMVRVACPLSVRAEIASQSPEIMTVGLAETASGKLSYAGYAAIKEHLIWADVIAIGPGLGIDDDTAKLVETLFGVVKLPFVIDADALNMLSTHGLILHLPKDSILTPHPGEFDRISGREDLMDDDEEPALLDDTDNVIPGPSDFYARVHDAQQFARQYKSTVLLKGSPTICFTAENSAVINPTGNPGLATAGAGDVLTGIVAALRAQGLDAQDAAWVGAFLHGRAADIAASRLGEASLIAGDVIDYLPAAFASIEEDEHDDEGHGHCNCG